ncbi:MAG: glyoxalase [Candidatus Puniceispirillaceae bacterium]
MDIMTEDIAADAMQHMEAAEVGRALRGFGLNLLCRRVIPLAESIASVLEMRVIRANDDYAIIAGPQVAKSLIIQLHADATYHANPLSSLLPDVGARGAGAEFRLFDMDPDAATRRAEVAGWHILQPPTDKPHGLRECYLLDLEGYCWVPGKVIA